MKRGCKAKLAEWLQATRATQMTRGREPMSVLVVQETMDLQIDQEALIDIQSQDSKRTLLS